MDDDVKAYNPALDLNRSVKLSRASSMQDRPSSGSRARGPSLRTQDLPIFDQVSFSAVDASNRSFSPFSEEKSFSAVERLDTASAFGNSPHRSPTSPIVNSFSAQDLADQDHPGSMLRRHQSLNHKSSRNGSDVAGQGLIPGFRSRTTSEEALRHTPSRLFAERMEGMRQRSQTEGLDSSANNSGSGSGEGSPTVNSPGDGLGRTPWSPTPEDDRILGNQRSRRALSAATPQEGLGINSSFNSNPSATTMEDMTSSFERTGLDQSPTSKTPAKRNAPSLSLITSFDGAAAAGSKSAGGVSPIEPPQSNNAAPRYQGPFSAAAYVRPIGHSFKASNPQSVSDAFSSPVQDIKGSFTAIPGAGKDVFARQKALIAGQTRKTESLNSKNEMLSEELETSTIPDYDQFEVEERTMPPQHFLQQQPVLPFSVSHLSSQLPPTTHWEQPPSSYAPWPVQNGLPQMLPHHISAPFAVQPPFPILRRPNGNFSTPPVVPPVQYPPPVNPVLQVQQMATEKGYNIGLDCNPPKARFCVIKSYTEEDVHKSIKYDIWSSTKLGNQRLDRVFRQNSSDGPLYLFFSVNGSGHFCGIAEMLSPVDETVDSNVWTDSKWKGIFKLRWHFIKDVPNNSLRHLRLHNTQEKKPVTSSRDTQEVPYDVGVEMLNIITNFPAKTSLLQDFAHYDALAQDPARQHAKAQSSSVVIPSTNSVHPPRSNFRNQDQRIRT